MSNIYTSVSQLIGRTPLLELCNIEKADSLKIRLLAKLEGCNPAGSAKDRVARNMIDDAEEKGLLKPGSVIIEPTSSIKHRLPLAFNSSTNAVTNASAIPFRR